MLEVALSFVKLVLVLVKKVDYLKLEEVEEEVVYCLVC